LPYFLIAAGDWIPSAGVPSWASSGAYGVEQWNCTTNSDTSLAEVHGPSRVSALIDCVDLSVMYLTFATTDAALNGVPSWNLTPLRSCSV
jgi:hypothetical protein